RISASDLESSLPCFGAAVREEHPIHTGDSRQPLRKRSRELVEKEVRRMNQPCRLFRDRLQYCAIPISQSIHANAGDEVEILASLGVIHIDVLTALEQQRNAIVSRQQKLRLFLFCLSQLHATITSVPTSILQV